MKGKKGFQKGHKNFSGSEKGWFTSERTKGENNTRWNNNPSYLTLHKWVGYNLGKAKKCLFCGKENGIEWANKSREYKRDLNDWIPLCRKCHAKYDNRASKILRDKNTGRFIKKSRGGE